MEFFTADFNFFKIHGNSKPEKFLVKRGKTFL